ncbi:MAG: serine hydrolase domain-containing protein [Pseudomonadota bacterium]
MFLPAKWGACLGGLLLVVATACSPSPGPDPQSPQTNIPDAVEADGFAAKVVATRAEYGLIALGAVVASRDGILDLAVDGVRSASARDPVEIGDQWHLGSNTKALTALLYGKLVDRGDAKWGASLPTLFPDFADRMDPAWAEITIEDLFAHRSGMKQLRNLWLMAQRSDERPITEQRYALAQETLLSPPQKDPSEFDYNNLNYIVAGAAIETILKQQDDLPNSWEAAMQSLLFDALDDPALRDDFGYGPPATGIEGHSAVLGMFPSAVGRGLSADNPPVLGPAGTLHATLAAHATLALEFLKDDSAIVPAELRQVLFAPFPDAESGYAMGWGVHDHSELGRLYQHSGSNTAWYSMIVIAPELDRVVIVNTNVFNAGAQRAANALARSVLEQAANDRDDQ